MSRSPLLALLGSLLIAGAPLALAQGESSSSDMYQPRDFQVDGAIQDRVEVAIDAALERDARRIVVEVRRGHVYLSGRVRDAEGRALAKSTALAVPGVQGVTMKKLIASRW